MAKVRNNIQDVNWSNIQLDNDNGLSPAEIRKKYNISRTLLNKAKSFGLINLKYFVSQNEINIRKESRMNFYKNNPDKHPWKNNSKFISKPCEIFKALLKENNINYVEEYSPLSHRLFSIDIAFPDKKIGIEINGNQHYDKNILKPYYQERHNLIEKDGWKLYEFHFSIVFNISLLNDIINIIKNDYNLGLINYELYLEDYNKLKKERQEKVKKEKLYNTCNCGKSKYKDAKMCWNCHKLNIRIHDRPDKKQLLLDVKNLGYVKTGKKYGVSDNAIRKWVNKS